MKTKQTIFIFLFLLSFTIVSATDNNLYSDCSIYGTCKSSTYSINLNNGSSSGGNISGMCGLNEVCFGASSSSNAIMSIPKLRVENYTFLGTDYFILDVGGYSSLGTVRLQSYNYYGDIKIEEGVGTGDGQMVIAPGLGGGEDTVRVDGNLKLNNPFTTGIASQCLQTDSDGLVSGTGVACGGSDTWANNITNYYNKTQIDANAFTSTNIAYTNRTNSFKGLQEFNSTSANNGLRLTNGTGARSIVDIFVKQDHQYSSNTAVYVTPTKSGADVMRWYWGNSTNQFYSFDYAGVLRAVNLPQIQIQQSAASTAYCSGDSGCSAIGNDVSNLVVSLGDNGYIMSTHGSTAQGLPLMFRSFANNTNAYGKGMLYNFDTQYNITQAGNQNHTSWTTAARKNVLMTLDMDGNLATRGNVTLGGLLSLPQKNVAWNASLSGTVMRNASDNCLYYANTTAWSLIKC